MHEPPKAAGTFCMEDDDIQSTEDLARYCTSHHITKEMLTGGDVCPDPDILGDIPLLGVDRSHGPRLPYAVPVAIAGIHIGKGKEKLENAARNMAADPRPTNTAVRRRHSSSHIKLVEVT